MRYHIQKATRDYEGVPYSGASNNNQPAEAETMEEAVHVCTRLHVVNPVGWKIWDSATGLEVVKTPKEEKPTALIAILKNAFADGKLELLIHTSDFETLTRLWNDNKGCWINVAGPRELAIYEIVDYRDTTDPNRVALREFMDDMLLDSLKDCRKGYPTVSDDE